MCGIAGIFEKNKDNRRLMSVMLDEMQHRGPDDKSVHVHGDFTLGHRRLSIIDLDTGNQPVFNETRDVAVVFNGEIYNFKELRQELQEKGHRFYTRSDTEVIAHLYEEHDIDFPKRLNGIFAIALLDQRRDRLVLVRDRFGVKPLHYHAADGMLLFASEQKAIIRHPRFRRRINYKALHLHLNLRYTPGNETLIDGIKRLPPAHVATFEGGLLGVYRYWQLAPRVDRSMTAADAMTGINARLKEAVRRQLVSDVPLGVYLSGGLDSSAIVQKMHELGTRANTFTLGFNEPTDELNEARIVARHFDTCHRDTTLPAAPLACLPHAIWHAEEPKINLLQGFNLSAFVRPLTKVVLGGVGGDELFAGYDIHRIIYPSRAYLQRRVPALLRRLLDWKSRFVYRLQTAIGGMSLDEYRRGVQMLCAIGDAERFYLILRNAWDHDAPFYNDIYSPAFLASSKLEGAKVHREFDDLFRQANRGDALEQVLFVELHTKMVNDYLLVEDRVSMAHSVEQRVPFLDIDLVEFAFSIPVELKIRHGNTKDLFRRALAPYLPREVIKKKKQGFAANPYLLFKKELGETARRILTRERVERQGIFNHEYIRRIIEHAPSPRLRWHYNFLWLLVGLAVWEEQFLGGKREEHIEAYY
ncbi:MAG: asparagine synthase (glutamine-hydrolyzing) [Odoribacteraceae bacterium]|jgi:asparagine synthase (glutamine-hydrolysing)|nr:asparagine synthase (glutamine-hydrolyzing) [Odoribacteraceae bacterium]